MFEQGAKSDLVGRHAHPHAQAQPLVCSVLGEKNRCPAVWCKVFEEVQGRALTKSHFPAPGLLLFGKTALVANMFGRFFGPSTTKDETLANMWFFKGAVVRPECHSLPTKSPSFSHARKFHSVSFQPLGRSHLGVSAKWQTCFLSPPPFPPRRERGQDRATPSVGVPFRFPLKPR